MSETTKRVPDELQKFLERYPDTQRLELLQPDMLGILRGKRVTRDEFAKPFAGGLNFCGATVLLPPSEAIGLPEAIAAFTINAAYTNRIDDRTGSIEVGKLADLIVLDRNLFEIPAAEISEAKPLVTLLEGKPVHGDLEAL